MTDHIVKMMELLKDYTDADKIFNTQREDMIGYKEEDDEEEDDKDCFNEISFKDFIDNLKKDKLVKAIREMENRPIVFSGVKKHGLTNLAQSIGRIYRHKNHKDYKDSSFVKKIFCSFEPNTGRRLRSRIYRNSQYAIINEGDQLRIISAVRANPFNINSKGGLISGMSGFGPASNNNCCDTCGLSTRQCSGHIPELEEVD